MSGSAQPSEPSTVQLGRKDALAALPAGRALAGVLQTQGTFLFSSVLQLDASVPLIAAWRDAGSPCRPQPGLARPPESEPPPLTFVMSAVDRPRSQRPLTPRRRSATRAAAGRGSKYIFSARPTAPPSRASTWRVGGRAPGGGTSGVAGRAPGKPDRCGAKGAEPYRGGAVGNWAETR